jgi:hypothetical protein
MYCLIQDAWPEYNFGTPNTVRSQQITESYENIKSNKNFKNETRPEMQISNNYNYNQINKMNENLNNKVELNCNSFYNHINECSECREKFMKYYCNRNYSLTKLIDENPQLKETLLIFLIGLLILFLLNLFRVEN